MKILFNTMTLGKGGAERVINILSNNFSNTNDVMIITNVNSNIDYAFNKNITVKSIAKKENKIIRKINRISIIKILNLKKEIIKFSPDIIISFLPEPSFRVLLLKKYSSKIKKIPIIVSVRNDPKTEYKNPLFYFVMKKLYPLATRLVLQTEDAKKYFKNTINIDGIVIANPVDDTFIEKMYDGIREKIIVAVGRLEPQKNYKMLIDAFEIVSKNHKDYILKIYGDGNLKNKIENYIYSKNLENKIILMGKVNNIKEEIFKATAFVMSSNYEGMPNSLLEAACLGLPCISTNCPCGGPNEILNKGKNGILINVNDFTELANKINFIIENLQIAKRYGENSNNDAYKYLSETVINKWMKIIDELK